MKGVVVMLLVYSRRENRGVLCSLPGLRWTMKYRGEEGISGVLWCMR